MNAARPELPLKVVAGHRSDVRMLAAQVFERHGIALKEDDPAFALVTLNELILRKLTSELLSEVNQQIAARLAEFEKTMQQGEQRASKTLAHQVRESAGVLRRTLQDEIAGAQLLVARTVEQLGSTYPIERSVRWCAIGTVVACVLFCCGFWIGRF